MMITKSHLENVRAYSIDEGWPFKVFVRQASEGYWTISVRYYWRWTNEDVATCLCTLEPQVFGVPRQLMVRFDTAEEAIAYCNREGIALTDPARPLVHENA